MQAVYATEQLPEPPKQTSVQESLCRGLVIPRLRVFPIHESEKVIRNGRSRGRSLVLLGLKRGGSLLILLMSKGVLNIRGWALLWLYCPKRLCSLLRPLVVFGWLDRHNPSFAGLGSLMRVPWLRI